MRLIEQTAAKKSPDSWKANKQEREKQGLHLLAFSEFRPTNPIND
jgi:hypothetical protein